MLPDSVSRHEMYACAAHVEREPMPVTDANSRSGLRKADRLIDAAGLWTSTMHSSTVYSISSTENLTLSFRR